MTQNKINKLELTWIGNEDEPLAIEPRLLIDSPEYSFGEVETGTLPNGKPWPGNMLIHGDNLLALRALEQDFAGQIKCIYIDPPYNINLGDLWLDIKTTGLDNEGVVAFKNSKKPEKLIKRIIQLNTKENDLVLDSFLGSGTTAAVAHKMKRRWIGVELGDHAYSHCAVRLQKVVEVVEIDSITVNP